MDNSYRYQNILNTYTTFTWTTNDVCIQRLLNKRLKALKLFQKFSLSWYSNTEIYIEIDWSSSSSSSSSIVKFWKELASYSVVNKDYTDQGSVQSYCKTSSLFGWTYCLRLTLLRLVAVATTCCHLQICQDSDSSVESGCFYTRGVCQELAEKGQFPL